MKNSQSKHHQLFTWMIGTSLFFAPFSAPMLLQAQQSQPQQNQGQPGAPGNWGPAGPPPDVQNGEIPPPPADAQSGQQPENTPDGAPPPPPGPQALPPPAPPSGYGQPGRAPYEPSPNPQSYRQDQAQAPLPSSPVAIHAGTLLQVRTAEPLDTKKLQSGDYFQATLAQNVYLGNVLAIPRGAELTGRVVDVKKPGELKGGASLTLQLMSMSLGGHSYPLESDTWSFNGPGKGGYTAGNAVGGAALGAVIGAIAGGGPGAAVGAVAGTGAGLGVSAATPGPRGVLPAEAVLTFHLTKPITVQPVSREEVQQLENSVPPEQRGSGYARPYGYAPAGGAPPPPYYYPAPYAYGYPAPYPYVYAYPRPYPYWYGYRRWR